MRPQDIVVLLKLITCGEDKLLLKDLSSQLFISLSEISESLNRSAIAGLLEPQQRTVNWKAFLEFLEHGLQYVFPSQPGAVTYGVYTGHSASALYQHFTSDEKFVWADKTGKERGQSISPLYPSVIKAAKKDQLLFKLLALCEIIRIGDVKEKPLAVMFLKDIIKG